MSVLMRRISIVVLAAAAAFAITAIGQTLWGALVIINLKFTPLLPWSALIMPFVLAALVAFLAGRGWPKAGAEARRKLVPLAPVSGEAWFWALLAGALANVVGASLWTVLATLVRVPPNMLPDTHGIPMLTLVPILLVSIIAPPLSEEIAFRGYAMGMIRRQVSPITALVITSALFAAVHLTQGLYAPKLLVYFLAGLSFGFVALRGGALDGRPDLLHPGLVARCGTQVGQRGRRRRLVLRQSGHPGGADPAESDGLPSAGRCDCRPPAARDPNSADRRPQSHRLNTCDDRRLDGGRTFRPPFAIYGPDAAPPSPHPSRTRCRRPPTPFPTLHGRAGRHWR